MQNQDTDLTVLEQRLRTSLAASSAARLTDTPDFPLAFGVELPDGLRSSRGNVGIRFSDFAIEGITAVCVDPQRSSIEGNRASLSLAWDELRVVGRYTLTAMPVPVITMDTAGSLLDYDDNDVRPAGAPAVTPLDPAQQSAMLDQARQQRTRLMDTPNGAQLLNHYNEHNETFNTVFATSQAARAAWAAHGATKDMAIHTHAALDPNDHQTTIVNPHETDATFGTQKVSYNQNAFVQQLQITVNTIAADPNFNPFDPNAKPDPNSKFTKAAIAALTFKSAVGQTGNSKSNTHPMTGEQVHGSVKTGSPPPHATLDELNNVIQQGVQPGGGAAAVAIERNWRVLDEDDRRLVRRHLYATSKERAERAEASPDTLWSGACGARIAGASAQIELEFGADARVLSSTIELPAFEFELDDSAWSGAAAEIARERLGAVSFIRSLLRERIETGLGEQIASAARAAGLR
jgi:hypothetical protein